MRICLDLDFYSGPLVSCITLETFHELSKPQFPHFKNEKKNSIRLKGWL